MKPSLFILSALLAFLFFLSCFADSDPIEYCQASEYGLTVICNIPVEAVHFSSETGAVVQIPKPLDVAPHLFGPIQAVVIGFQGASNFRFEIVNASTDLPLSWSIHAEGSMAQTLGIPECQNTECIPTQHFASPPEGIPGDIVLQPCSKSNPVCSYTQIVPEYFNTSIVLFEPSVVHRFEGHGSVPLNLVALGYFGAVFNTDSELHFRDAHVSGTLLVVYTMGTDH
ncbi:MAG: hypothetical protein KDD64_14695 [Bdellovibrionales bacterium]|nr:hypothetical protein [Bdellovibrionales bacterium]